MAQDKLLKLSINKTVRSNQIEALDQCVKYILESEQDDFETYVSQGNAPDKHIYASAYVAVYGLNAYQKMTRELVASTFET